MKGAAVRKWPFLVLLLLAAGWLLLLLPAAVAAGGYTITDLGPAVMDMVSCAADINEAGQIVGYTLTWDEAHETQSVAGCLWENGVVTGLGTLGGTESCAVANNEAGQVVGWARASDGYAYPCLWENGTISDLSGGPGVAEDINDTGQVVGGAAVTDVPHAWLWENGTGTDLGALVGSGYSYAYGINSAGQIVGEAQAPQGIRACLWENGTVTDLGTLGGYYSRALAISGNGQVVGWSHTSEGYPHACLWENGTITDLGTLGGLASGAEDVNEAGQVVGWSLTSEGYRHACLWENGTITDLGTLGGDDSFATEVNEVRQIVGSADAFLPGPRHACLWQPIPDTEPPVITAPGEVVAEASGPGGVMVDFVASASDLVDGEVAVNYSAEPGTLFPLGATEVTVSATDQAGNTATATIQVRVVDTTAPTLAAPPDLEVPEGGPLGTSADLGDPVVSDLCDPSPAVTNDAPSLFSLGVTIVTWTATDAAGNSATAQQQVTVIPGPPANQLATLKALIQLLIASGQIAPGPGVALLAKVEAAAARVSANDVTAAIKQLTALIGQVNAMAQGHQITQPTAEAVIARAQAVIATLGG